MKKILITAFILSFVANLSVFAANNNWVNATIANNIKIYFNQSLFKPIETDGKEVKPLLYNNRTYLPVRAIAEKSNLDVQWDAASESIYLTKSNDQINNWLPDKSGQTLLYPGNNILDLNQTGRILTNANVQVGFFWDYNISNSEAVRLKSKRTLQVQEPYLKNIKPGEPYEEMWDFERIGRGACEITLIYKQGGNAPVYNVEPTIIKEIKYIID